RGQRRLRVRPEERVAPGAPFRLGGARIARQRRPDVGVERVHAPAVIEELEVGLLLNPRHRSFNAADEKRPLRTRAVVGNAWTVCASTSMGVPSFSGRTAAWIASPAPCPAMNAPS